MSSFGVPQLPRLSASLRYMTALLTFGPKIHGKGVQSPKIRCMTRRGGALGQPSRGGQSSLVRKDCEGFGTEASRTLRCSQTKGKMSERGVRTTTRIPFPSSVSMFAWLVCEGLLPSFGSSLLLFSLPNARERASRVEDAHCPFKTQPLYASHTGHPERARTAADIARLIRLVHSRFPILFPSFTHSALNSASARCTPCLPALNLTSSDSTMISAHKLASLRLTLQPLTPFGAGATLSPCSNMSTMVSISSSTVPRTPRISPVLDIYMASPTPTHTQFALTTPTTARLPVAASTPISATMTECRSPILSVCVSEECSNPVLGARTA